MDFPGGQKRKKVHFDTQFHIFGSTWHSNNFKTCFQIMKFSEINATRGHKIAKKKERFFSVFDAKYFLNKRTVT